MAAGSGASSAPLATRALLEPLAQSARAPGAALSLSGRAGRPRLSLSAPWRGWPSDSRCPRSRARRRATGLARARGRQGGRSCGGRAPEPRGKRAALPCRLGASSRCSAAAGRPAAAAPRFLSQAPADWRSKKRAAAGAAAAGLLLWLGARRCEGCRRPRSPLAASALLLKRRAAPSEAARPLPTARRLLAPSCARGAALCRSAARERQPLPSALRPPPARRAQPC